MIHCFPLPTSYPSEVGGKSRNSSESKANKNSRAFRGRELGLWWNNLIFTQFHLQSLFWEGLDGKRICLQCRRRGFDPWFGKIPYSSILAWRIPMDRGAWRAQRVGHDWATKQSTWQAQPLGASALAAESTFCPLPLFPPGLTTCSSCCQTVPPRCLVTRLRTWPPRCQASGRLMPHTLAAGRLAHLVIISLSSALPHLRSSRWHCC